MIGTDESRALRDAVRSALAQHSRPRAAMDSPLGYDDKLWSLLCEQIGVGALAIPEAYGGAGATWAEVCVVAHELGRTLTPCPFLGSAMLAARALVEAGDDQACTRLLPGIADGSRIAALAWTGQDGAWSPDAPFAVADGSTVDGEAHYVLDGDLADVLLVAARTSGGVALFEVDPGDPGVRREHTPALDPTRRLATVTFTRASARRIGSGDSAWLSHVRDLAVVALAAEQTGAAEQALDATVGYTRQRHQFGRPIGSFQALKHRMADAFVQLEAARSAVHAAVTSALAGSAELPLDAATARITCSEAFSHIAAEMIQLHGGIAITWEHDAHLYFKRAQGTAFLLGTPRECLAAF